MQPPSAQPPHQPGPHQREPGHNPENQTPTIRLRVSTRPRYEPGKDLTQPGENAGHRLARRRLRRSARHAAVPSLAGPAPTSTERLSQMLGARSILLHRTLVTEGQDLTDTEHHRQLVYEHAAVRDAIARSDPDGARAAMRSHLLRSRSTLR